MTGSEKFDKLAAGMENLKSRCKDKQYGDIVYGTTLECAIKFAAYHMSEQAFNSFMTTLSPKN